MIDPESLPLLREVVSQQLGAERAQLVHWQVIKDSRTTQLALVSEVRFAGMRDAESMIKYHRGRVERLASIQAQLAHEAALA